MFWSKRKDKRTLVDMVNAIILSAISKFLFDQWKEALLSICYVHNRVQSQRYFMCYEMRNLHFKMWEYLTFCKMIDQRGLISQRTI